MTRQGGSAERVQTLGLLARQVDYGEADRICTLLTETAGKVSALAKSARSSRKRFGGALSLFVLGQAELGPPRRGSELRPLDRFEAIEDLAGPLGGDLVKVTHGSYVLELARELWPAEQAEPRLFGLVLDTLRVLAALPAAPSLLRCFELHLLSLLGLAPSFERCVRCDQPIASDDKRPLAFSVAAGGVTCATCGPQGWPISFEVRRELRNLAALAPAAAAVHLCAVSLQRDVRDVTMLILRNHLGRDLRSWQFLEQLGANLRKGA